jgi:hypothetical protein
VLTTRTMHWFIKRGFQPVDPDWLPEARKRKYNWDRRSQVLVKKLSDQGEGFPRRAWPAWCNALPEEGSRRPGLRALPRRARQAHLRQRQQGGLRALWKKHQTMLVNENRLNLADARARQYLARQMESSSSARAPSSRPATCRRRPEGAPR